MSGLAIQTLRNREISIFVLFYSWFESPNDFSFTGLKQMVEALKSESLDRDYFLKQINHHASFGSKLIHEKEATARELDSTLSQIHEWLKENEAL